MSRSVSAPSSVTNTSPCWNGLIVPGSTLMYGSNFCTCTLRPRAFSSRPSDAAVIPLPRDETTPPVTKTNFATYTPISVERPTGHHPSSALTARDRRDLAGRGGLNEVVEPFDGEVRLAATRRYGDTRAVGCSR